MPIVSSQIVRNHNRGNGVLSIHEQHIDHLGGIHEHKYRCPLDYDVDLALINWASILEANLIQNEKDIVFNSVSKGADPNLIIVKYISNLQKAKQALKALMFGRAENVIKAAEFVSSFSDVQIENHFTVVQRIRIRIRQDYVLNNQAIIEADAMQREEL